MSMIYNVNGEPLSLDTVGYTTPEAFGAYGDGIHDDTSSIQTAVNGGGLILFGMGKTYNITSAVRLPRNTILDLNESTLLYENASGMLRILENFFSTDTDVTGYAGNGNIIIRNGTIIGGNISFAHGENILLENVIFKDGISPHFLEICACKNYCIRNCRFVGIINTDLSVQEYINIDPATYRAFPLLPDGSAFFDGAKNDGITVENCYFGLGENDYAYGFNALGVHGVAGQETKHRNIRLVGNTLRGFTGCGFRINDMENVLIADNDIQVAGDGIRVGDVGQSTKVIIKSNVITSSGTAVIKANNSTVFQSADNDINPTFS